MEDRLGFQNNPEIRPRRRDYSLPFKKRYLIIFIFGIVAIIAIMGYSLLHTKQSTNKVLAASEQPSLPAALITKQVNQSFTFPINDAKGQKISQFTYTVEQAELRNQIVVRGQEAEAVSGKTFLILDLKLTNDYDQAIDVNTRNFIRFGVDGDTKDLQAADIHNDPVNVQAKSTKYTKLALTVPSNIQKVTLFIGDITASKTQITIPFH